MEYRLARTDERSILGTLCWQFASELERAGQPCEDFLPHFAEWADSVSPTHTPFVAVDDGVIIGMAWLARVRRTPRPGPVHRCDGDLQTVFVLPERRNAGVGEALLNLLLEHAWQEGIDMVTVSSSERAISVYQRVGFTGVPPYLRVFNPRDNHGRMSS